jgi:hypothetical protein
VTPGHAPNAVRLALAAPRYWPAHIGGDAERQGGGFRCDRMSVAVAMLAPCPGLWGTAD